jgi:uncharacterized protein
VRYDWDPAKSAENVRNHDGVHFGDAVGVLEDPYALTVPDRYPREQRWNTVGRDFLDRVVFLCWTYAAPEVIRVISARRATPRERRQYAEDADG